MFDDDIMNATHEEVTKMLLDAGYTQGEIDAMGERILRVVEKAKAESPMNPENKGNQSMADERKCQHCNKPEQNIPPGYSSPMCQDCWATKTEEGKAWVREYYGKQAAYEQMMREEEMGHPDYLDEGAVD